MALDDVRFVILFTNFRKVTYLLPAVAGYHAVSAMLLFFTFSLTIGRLIKKKKAQ